MTIFKNFLLIIITFIIMLFIAEGLVRLCYPQEMNGSTKVLSTMGYALNRSDGNIIAQQGTTRIMHYRFYPPGLRNTEANPPATHILALGDSITFGWLLPFHETFIYHLQQSFNKKFGKNKYQLLDAGSGGWGAADFLAYLKEFGAETHPKFVIVFLDSDDIGRAVALNIFKLKNTNSLQLENNFHPFPHARLKNFLNKGSWYNFLLEHSHLFQLTRNVFIHMQSSARANQLYMNQHQHTDHPAPVFFRNESSAQVRYAVALGKAIFYHMQQWCLLHHAKLLVITTGYNAFYPKNTNDPTKAFLKQAPEFFASQHIAFHDIAPEFKKAVHGKVFQLAGDSHPNALGTKIMANLMAPWLEKKITPPLPLESSHQQLRITAN